METDVDVVVNSGAPAAGLFLATRVLFAEQERRFSRFVPTSLLSALNRGEEVHDGAFAAAVRLALEAHEVTGGLFNPMVLAALEDAGYDRTFADVATGVPRRQAVPDPRDALVLHGDRVALRRGRLDLGGIVKGWTVDLAVERLADGCDGVLVNAGGDLRAAGSEDAVEGWLVAVAAPGSDAQAWEGVLTGALATSTTLKRRWGTASGPAHHIIDPRTGLPATSPYVQVTAWAAETWLAETWAKAVLVGGEGGARACLHAGHRLLAFEADGSATDRT